MIAKPSAGLLFHRPMLLSRKSLLTLAASALMWAALPSSALGQGAYVRSGGYNSDCIIRPRFDRPEFVKSAFVHTEFVRPEHLKRETTHEAIARVQFEYPAFERSQIIRPQFHRCTDKEKSSEGGYRPAGYSTMPRFGQNALPAGTMETAKALQVRGLAQTSQGATDAECCNGPLLIPSAAKSALR
jgi:hypothetical protein